MSGYIIFWTQNLPFIQLVGKDYALQLNISSERPSIIGKLLIPFLVSVVGRWGRLDLLKSNVLNVNFAALYINKLLWVSKSTN